MIIYGFNVYEMVISVFINFVIYNLEIMVFMIKGEGLRFVVREVCKFDKLVFVIKLINEI